MPPLPKRWQVAAAIPPEVESNLSGYPPILRQILYNRGYPTPEAARQYVEARVPPGTDPFNILGMAEAVDRLEYAIRAREPIAVYGDYDVDGVTATTLLVQSLNSLGAQAIGYIPNRFEEGYGLNKEALETLSADGIRLVITVDCGIRALEEAEHARKLGLDLIISDHHEPRKELPKAVARINPKQPGDLYPEKELAGVGLAYKLVMGLQAFLERRGDAHLAGLNPDDLLDLVALGTVADLAPLTGENRALVRAGLQAIRRPRRQGLMSLIGVCGLRADQVTSTHIGFALGPRLNAAGRLDSALAAYQLLTTQDVFEAGRIAQILDGQNRERQKITRDIQAHAEQLALADDPDALLLFAAHPDYNSGVVGLAASRLADLYYRPAIVAQKGEEYTRGSCRSIPEFHITEALDQCADLLEHHGGHAAAAGFTVHNDNLPALVRQLQEIANQQLAGRDLRPIFSADAEIPLADLRPDLLKYLELLQPTGFKNRGAMFASRDLKVRSHRTVGRDGSHLKLTVTDGWITFDAIAFRQGHWEEQMPERIDLMFTFEQNEFNGRTSLQLNVRDLKPAGMPD
ncbi:MAG: single-stranded-DNA-specific exonuclease RecJ [Anaerolineales bacterium]